jgi:hypothetical protein
MEEDYTKVLAVIESCETLDQFNIAWVLIGCFGRKYTVKGIFGAYFDRLVIASGKKQKEIGNIRWCNESQKFVHDVFLHFNYHHC